MMNLSTGGKAHARTISPKKSLGCGYFIAAVIFLFNPCINLVDVLPDFFGYMFLLSGLRKWADLCPNVADASAGIGKLRWFMLVKMFAILLVPIVDDTYVLVLTFGFIVVELMYAIPAASRIYDGFEYFGTRFDSRSVFKNLKSVRTLTNIFFFVKSAFCLFPELCSLSDFEYSGYVTSGVQIDIAKYRVPLAGLNLFVGAIIGVIWLVNMIAYIRNVSKDTPFLQRVMHDYELEVGTNIGLAFRRNLRTSTTLLIAGIVFFPNLWIDGVNIIPTFIGALFLLAAMLKLSKMSPVSKSTVAATAVFGVLSIVSYAASLIFEVYYGIAEISRSFEAYELYNMTLILSLLEYAAMAASVFLIIREFRKLIRMHLGPDPDVTDKRLTDIYATHQHEADMRLLIGLVGFFIALVINVAYALLRASVEPQFYLVAFLAMGIWFIYMISSLNQLYDQIEYKYI